MKFIDKLLNSKHNKTKQSQRALFMDTFRVTNEEYIKECDTKTVWAERERENTRFLWMRKKAPQTSIFQRNIRYTWKFGNGITCVDGSTSRNMYETMEGKKSSERYQPRKCGLFVVYKLESFQSDKKISFNRYCHLWKPHTHTHSHTSHSNRSNSKKKMPPFRRSEKKTYVSKYTEHMQEEVVLSLSSFLYYIINQLINTPAEDVTQDTP